MTVSAPAQQSPREPETAALLERSAPLARLLADSLCRAPIGRDHCGALHGVWPDLRLLGAAAEPDRHAAFYADALAARAAAGASERVLVSGCADWGMLATTVSAYRHQAAPLDVTVVDRCPTPTLLCAWYGAQVGMPVRTAVADVGEYQESRPFDLICTHSLLRYPVLEGRHRLVENWRKLVRPGGAVVTVTRLSREPASSPDPESARRFADRIVRRCAELGLDRDPIELRARAERFSTAQVAHAVGDATDLRELFEQHGFEVVRLETPQLEGPVHVREPIGGAARSGSYGEIVAVRR